MHGRAKVSEARKSAQPIILRRASSKIRILAHDFPDDKSSIDIVHTRLEEANIVFTICDQKRDSSPLHEATPLAISAP
ncbi:hypothetical protein ACFSQT_38445 [Mesorhizobium calcicola]|uniref:Uncharacterized protein n=1 Tax=Mesorhizobium calcicola TaxID=1300310 RepID=A0ABW4WSW6_9HYPH